MTEITNFVPTDPHSVKVGDKVEFAVTATGTGNLTYVWSKDGTDITGADQPTYPIEKAEKSHAGKYQVTVIDASNDDKSKTCVLTVEDAPVAPEDGEGGDGADPPQIWDPKFAWITGLLLLALFIIATIWMGNWGPNLAAAKETTPFSFALTRAFFHVGVFLTLVATYLGLLHYRGNAKLPPTPAAPTPEVEVTTRTLTALIEAAPGIMTSFGKLRLFWAAIVFAVVIFLMALLAAWRVTPSADPPEPTPTATATSTTDTPPVTKIPQDG